MNAALASLASQYRHGGQHSAKDEWRKKLRSLAGTMAQQRVATLTDSAVLAAVIYSVTSQGMLDIDALPEPVREAFSLAYPNLDLNELDGKTAEELAGYMNAWQGKLFEVSVRDELNAGETVGDWQLEPGQTAELAESATQAGWDLAIRNADGTVDQLVQLKATESVSYIQAALERYPDIPIIATADQAENLSHLSSVSHSNLHTEDLSGAVQGAGLVDAGVSASDALMPASVIMATELLAVAAGKKTFDQALESGAGRVVDAGISTVAGLAAASLFGGPVGVGVALLARWLLGRERQKYEERTRSKAQPESDQITLKGRRFNNSEAVDTFDKRRSLAHQASKLLLFYRPEFKFDKADINLRFWDTERQSDLWVGEINRTHALVVYDPLIQVPNDKVVWVYFVKRQCLRAFPPDQLRTKVQSRQRDESSHPATDNYLRWMRLFFENALTHIEKNAFVPGDRPAFAGIRAG